MQLILVGRRYPRSGLLGSVLGLLAVLIVSLSPTLAYSQGVTNLPERDTPGCALGVNENGNPAFRDAYGLADLEHGVPLKTDSIMEAGSVSKQFSAAATILLMIDGKLSLSDDIRKYVPEVPEYEIPIQIRHLINHTNGLRDWGHIADIRSAPLVKRLQIADSNRLHSDSPRMPRLLAK